MPLTGLVYLSKTSAGPVAQWIRRLTSDQKIASSSLVGVELCFNFDAKNIPY